MLYLVHSAGGLPAQEAAPPALSEDAITFGQDYYQLTIPASWQKKEPRSTIVQYEFALPNPAGQADGRITMMSAGGSVKANMDRWIGQFAKSDPVQETLELAECKVHTLSIQGTYKDKPGGPFGASVDRADYRMLAAIVATPKHGNFFIKFYGPQDLISAGEADFKSLLESLAPTK